MPLIFLKLITAGKIREAYDTYASSSLFIIIHTSKLVLKRWQKGWRSIIDHIPNRIYEIKHILRSENDKIVELWDVGEEIPKNSFNEDGMF